jgi:hypothetical protein
MRVSPQLCRWLLPLGMWRCVHGADAAGCCRASHARAADTAVAVLSTGSTATHDRPGVGEADAMPQDPDAGNAAYER